jgi:hypothetical protein
VCPGCFPPHPRAQAACCGLAALQAGIPAAALVGQAVAAGHAGGGQPGALQADHAQVGFLKGRPGMAKHRRPGC